MRRRIAHLFSGPRGVLPDLRTLKSRRALRAAWAAGALLVLTSPARADEVLFANGDRITGKVIGLADGKLTMETPYAKSLELDWASVTGLRLDGVSQIVLTDGTRLQGTTEITPAGGMSVVTDSAGAVNIRDFSLVSAINPPEVKAVTYTGNAQAAAALTSGNSETLNANLSAQFVARSERQRLTLRGLYHYGEDRDRISAREASGSVKYDFFVTRKLYTFVNTLLEHNKFQDLNLRTTVGGGLGYQFLEDARKTLGFELGVSYFNEDFAVNPDDAYAAGRWSVNATYELLPERISLFHFHEGYFGFEDLSDLYLRSEQGVRFTLIQDFYTTFQANVNYDNTPPDGFEKTDTTLLFGLGYAFDL
ncbi:MAG: DUF481 domain-containing protein [bacterium]